MIIQHNMSAANANRMLGKVVSAQSKATEKLSSGYRINRAADDAAGLSISEKMRGQIRGLSQASTNAEDGISLIQTAEGALEESHSILQRMRQLAVQAANGTQTADDREAIQDEITQLQDELTRISETTEFNTMKLLDGSLDGAASSISDKGPKFGSVTSTGIFKGAILTSNVSNVKVTVDADADIKVGSESAVWQAGGTELKLNLKANTTYTQAQIDDLIANATFEDSTQTNAPADIEFTLNNGVMSVTTGTASTSVTAAGVAATNEGTAAAGEVIGADKIKFTSNVYGAELNGVKFTFSFDVKAGAENVEVDKAQAYDDTNTVTQAQENIIHLAAGKEYSEADLEAILKEAGYDITVDLSNQASTAPDEAETLFNIKSTGGFKDVTITLAGGAGVGDTDALWGQEGYDGGQTGANGMTLHIGANEGQTMGFSIQDMSAAALKVDASRVNIKTAESAEKAITSIDEAIKTVSKSRSAMGAVQNRLEHTISNLDTAAENLQTAESRIRDVDMAEQMVEFSKNNILQQAAQSMLAQANQSTQGVLSLLG